MVQERIVFRDTQDGYIHIGGYVDSSQYKFGNACMRFSGRSSVVSAANSLAGHYAPGITIYKSSDMAGIAAGSFCVDMWIKVDCNWLCNLWAINLDFSLDLLANGSLKLWDRNSTVILTTSAGVLVDDGLFHHVEVDENGDNYYLFIDGVLIASAISTFRFGTSNTYFGTIGIGDYSSGSGNVHSFAGWIDEFRVSRVYRNISAFTPPTEEYTADDNTAFLSHFDKGASSSFYPALMACSNYILDYEAYVEIESLPKGEWFTEDESEMFRVSLVPADGTIKDFRLSVNTPLSSGTAEFILVKNGVETELGGTLSAGDTDISDSSNQVSVVAGDKLSLKVTLSGDISGSLVPNWTFRYVGSISGSSIICSGAKTLGDFMTLDSLIGSELNNPYNEEDYAVVMSCAGTIKNLYVHASSLHQAGQSMTLKLRKNGVDTSLAVTLNDSIITAADTTHEVAVVAGDTLTFGVLSTDETYEIHFIKSVLFIPTVANDFQILSIHDQFTIYGSDTVEALPYYFAISDAYPVTGFIENPSMSVVSSVTLKRISVKFSESFDQYGEGIEQTFTVMKNGLETGLQVVCSGVPSYFENETNVTFSDGDKISIKGQHGSDSTSADILCVSLCGNSSDGQIIVSSSRESVLAGTRCLEDSSGNVPFDNISLPWKSEVFLDTDYQKFGASSLRSCVYRNPLRITGDRDLGFGGTGFCVDFWVRINVVSNGGLFYQSFSPQSGGGNETEMGLFLHTDGSVHFSITKSSPNTIYVRIDTVAGLLSVDGLFHHVELNYDGNSYYLFFDGQLVGTDAVGLLAWDSGTSYIILDSVLYNGIHYISRTSNLNKQPDTNPSDWRISNYDISQVSPWDSGTSYSPIPAPGSAVSYGGDVYFSLNPSVNKQPDIEPDYWLLYEVGTGFINTATLSKDDFFIGYAPGVFIPGSSADLFDGWIDEFRISSVARHTSNFTPPTSAYTSDGNTELLLHFD